MVEQDDRFILPGLAQIAAVVSDVDRTADYYFTNFGIGPFRIVTVALPQVTLRGKPGSLKLRLGLATLGSVRFELIEVPPGESLFREFMEAKGEGLHHLGFDVADVDKAVADLEQRGIGVVMEGRFQGGGFVYLDTEGVCGFIIELSQRQPGR